MNFYSKNRKLNLSVMIILGIAGFISLNHGSLSNASDVAIISGNPSLGIKEIPAAEGNQYFYLIEDRVIDAELLDDKMLENLSPSLIAPKKITLSHSEFQQKALQEYHHSICFKRCHTKNDFSVSDYTYQQWCLLIEKGGHSIFSEIPWENPEKKEKLFRYLVNNAKKKSSEPEGIGTWD